MFSVHSRASQVKRSGFFIGEIVSEIKWIKLSVDIFNNEKIKLIEDMPEGKTILIIWLKLLTLAGRKNDCGMIYITKDIPYTTETLSHILGENSMVVSLAINTFISFNMIEVEDNFIYISGWEKHQNVEGMEKIREQGRIRQRRHREKQKSLECNVTSRDSNGIDKNRIDKNRIDKINKCKKPTLAQIKKYCGERSNDIDAEFYYNHFSAQGWKRSNGQEIVNWKNHICLCEKNKWPIKEKSIVDQVMEMRKKNERD